MLLLCANPKAQYESHRDEIDAAIRRVLESGIFMSGGETAALEREFASYTGTSEAVAVSNGTDALELALAACSIGANDEVITVSHTAVATVAAVEHVGATAVLVDIDPDTYTIDPGVVAAAITPRTKAIVPVHLYGHPADMDALVSLAREHELRIIEDCAQAHGATWRGRRVGSMGDAACFSFYPTKNLGALGNGGMVVTHDADLAGQVRRVREYGWNERRESEQPGWNCRIDEIQAAILRTKLPHLDADNQKRSEIALTYDKTLAGTGLVLPRIREGATHVYHLYVVQASRRDELQAFLRQREIQTGIHYATPVHLHPAYRGRLAGGDNLPVTEHVASRVLSLPMYPELSSEQIIHVVDSIRELPM